MTDFERFSLVIEGVKTTVSILIPISITALGVLLHRYQKSVESDLTHTRETYTRRFSKYETISSLINDIYCFHVLVGHYKSISPNALIEKKRKLESIFFSTLPLWNDSVVESLTMFLDVCFHTQRGPMLNPVSLADRARHESERSLEWNKDWDALFVEDCERPRFLQDEFGIGPNNSYRDDLVTPTYAALLSALSKSIGGGLSHQGALIALTTKKKTAQKVRPK